MDLLHPCEKKNNELTSNPALSVQLNASLHVKLQIEILAQSRMAVGNGLRDCHAVKVNFGSIVLVAN